MLALLDGHVLIWWMNDGRRLSSAQQDVVGSVSPGTPLLVSDNSLWEIATQYSLNRIRLTVSLQE